MTDPTKYHIVLSNGTELFNAVYWLDATSRPYSEVPPISYDPSLECLLSTEDGCIAVGKNYIILRETMETYIKRKSEESTLFESIFGLYMKGGI